ncbi:unannotated protein [freshwater metagenome]|uniref:Unannotated protein n=1 Tax=freshwater metagenome TaxID=449393 RepID=A0A6J7EHN4_9ZZZZ|nr:N-acetyltransferase [Actinomycetota bacterium]
MLVRQPRSQGATDSPTPFLGHTRTRPGYAATVIHPTVRVHQTAIVETGASVGAGTGVWHHAHVRSGAVVGEHCVLGKNVYIDTQARIGDRCKIQNNVSVYHGVVIDDDVFVGPSATFTNDLVPRAFNVEWTITTTRVLTGASIGANATIVCGTTLGRFSMVAAGATVTRDVADHQLVAGTPARHLGWVCQCGSVVSRESNPPESLVCELCAGKL